ncbi:hypothetical protein Pmani_022273 [Petrolisthes manimaculis]|uniref:Fucosyltransferase n=1 Tax=Petrolisthes manimaculis TaxID=1843537 RepID=A0AAE1PD19_9EUCA|nr:hypothetical protein Pmani_022273 [Petrolisthes manimaculis]
MERKKKNEEKDGRGKERKAERTRGKEREAERMKGKGREAEKTRGKEREAERMKGKEREAEKTRGKERKEERKRGTTSNNSSSSRSRKDYEGCPEHYQEEEEEGKAAPLVILVWTPFWHQWGAWRTILNEKARFRDQGCPVWRCEMRWDLHLTPREVQAADAILFFSLDVLARPLPPRVPRQSWIWLELEAPPISQVGARVWAAIETPFNLTMSYHHNNHIVVVDGYLVPHVLPFHCPVTPTHTLDTSTPTYVNYTRLLLHYDALLKGVEGQEGDQWMREEKERRHPLSRPLLDLTTPRDGENTAGGQKGDKGEKEEEAEDVGVINGEGTGREKEGGGGKGRNARRKNVREEEGGKGSEGIKSGGAGGRGEGENNIESDGRREAERSVKATGRKGWDREGGLQGRGRVADRVGGLQGRGRVADRVGGLQGRGRVADRERRVGDGGRDNRKEVGNKNMRKEGGDREGRRIEEERRDEGDGEGRQEKSERERKGEGNKEVRVSGGTVNSSTTTEIRKERRNETQTFTEQEKQREVWVEARNNTLAKERGWAERPEMEEVTEDEKQRVGEIKRGVEGDEKDRVEGDIKKKEEILEKEGVKVKERVKEEETGGDEGKVKDGMEMLLGLTQEEIHLATRPKVAAWMASHCPTESRREDLVAHLSRHIPVTTVGRCGSERCGRNHLDHHCYTWLAASHLFYLSLENAVCQDYVTEKLWRPLQFGLVPVVYGGGRYSKILPRGSYIDATDYPTAGDLAAHLLHLAAHPAQYARYLLWRRYWRVVWPTPWCDLCAALHRHSPTQHSITADRWWRNNARCASTPPVATA